MAGISLDSSAINGKLGARGAGELWFDSNTRDGILVVLPSCSGRTELGFDTISPVAVETGISFDSSAINGKLGGRGAGGLWLDSSTRDVILVVLPSCSGRTELGFDTISPVAVETGTSLDSSAINGKLGGRGAGGLWLDSSTRDGILVVLPSCLGRTELGFDTISPVGVEAGLSFDSNTRNGLLLVLSSYRR